MKKQKKDCAFQYVINPVWGGAKVFEDTKLITLDEAKKLWMKYKSSCIEHLRTGENPEMVIWIDMENETDYGTTFAHVDRWTETDGVEFFKITKEQIDL